MAENIVLKTWLGQMITATHDAIIQDAVIQLSGLLNGCTITYASGNVIHLAAGYGIIKGRLFEVYDTDLQVELPASGTLSGRIYVHMDLSAADAPIELRAYTGSTLPDLVQDDDCNYDNGIYEIELATFTAGTVAITDIVETATHIEGVLEDLMEQVAQLFLEKEDLPTVLSKNLAAGSTSLTFTNAAIKNTARIQPHASAWGVSPKTLVQSGSTVTMTFDAQQSAITVYLYIYET